MYLDLEKLSPYRECAFSYDCTLNCTDLSPLAPLLKLCKRWEEEEQRIGNVLLVVATNLVAEGQHARMIFWDPCFSISLCKEL